MHVAWLNMSEQGLYQRLIDIGKIKVDLVEGYEFDFSKHDVVITEDWSIDLGQVRELRTKIPKVKMIHIIRQNNYEDKRQIELICKSYGISLLVHDFDNSKTIEEILKEIFPERYLINRGKKVAFLGTHSGVGVTSIVNGVADLLSQKAAARIGIIHLHPWSEGGNDKSGKSLDEITTLIKSNNMNSDQLFHAFTKKKDFYELRGNRDLLKVSRYEPHVVQQLLSMSEEVFDLILLNLGWMANHLLFVEGIQSADTHYLIATQERKSMTVFNEAHKQCLQGLKIDPATFLLVVNKIDPYRTYLPKQLSQQLNIPLLVEIPLVPSISEELEKENKLMSEHRLLEESIAVISKGILETYRLPMKEEQKSKQNKIFRLLGFKSEATRA